MDASETLEKPSVREVFSQNESNGHIYGPVHRITVGNSYLLYRECHYCTLRKSMKGLSLIYISLNKPHMFNEPFCKQLFLF